MSKRIPQTDHFIYSSEFKFHSYEIYHQQRQIAPLFQVPASFGFPQSYVILNYHDIQKLLKDPRVINDVRTVLPTLYQNLPPAREILVHHMLRADPPQHTQLRILAQKAFTPRMIETLRPRIEKVTIETLQYFLKHEEGDFIEKVALPLPMTIISEMLGIPEEDRDHFHHCCEFIVRNENDLQKAEQGSQEFINYLTPLIDKKRKHPTNDLISEMVLAESEGNSLTEKELYSMIFLLVLAGHETTVHLLGNGLLAFYQNTEQWQLLKSNPSLVESAIEEILRCHSPVEFALPRWTNDNIDLDGYIIPKKSTLFLSLASGNRDPLVFEDPDHFDITRTKNRHLGFGHGIHQCLGAVLGRLEGAIVFKALVELFDQIEIARDFTPTWAPSIVTRGLMSLPVRLSARK